MAIVALCLLAVAFYRHIALSNRILSGGDAFTYFFPYRAYAAETVCKAQVPLWNPYLFLGIPFLANPQAAVFYPLNLVLCWLSAPKLLAWSIVIHTALAAVFAYLYARRSLRLSPLPAVLGASAFALGGFLSGQVEHINQLNVSAWFPLLLLLWDESARVSGQSHSAPSPSRARLSQIPGRGQRAAILLALGAIVGLGLLAGHTQSTYISLFGLAIYALLPTLPHLFRLRRHPGAEALAGSPSPGAEASLREYSQVAGTPRLKAPLLPPLRALLHLALICAVGTALAAVQLLPTLELAQRSIRRGGLTYREAVAFSLKPLPRLLRYTFLPPWGSNLADVFGGSYFTEYLAYVGLVPLLLAGLWCLLGLVWVLRSWPPSLHEADLRKPSIRLALLGAMGVLLALGAYNPLYWVLYRIVPGFALFRVPARWLLLYAFALPMIAAAGLQRLGTWVGSWPTNEQRSDTRCPLMRAMSLPLLLKSAPAIAQAAAVALTLCGLFLASEALPFSQPTAPEAFSSLRTAPAHIRAAQAQSPASGRFLSLSDTLFDPGDLAEMRVMFQGYLSEGALYDYIVSAKRKEIIAPNLPLAWRMYAVDGYDGGLLPLERYILLQRLFLDEADILLDGRLREGIERVPPSRLLSILGTRYVITDKVHDVWIDDVFYDLAFDAVLDASQHVEYIAVQDIPAFQATGIGLVSYLEGAHAVADGTPVAEVRIEAATGEVHSFTLYAGQDTAEGRWRDSEVRHAQARVGHTWRDDPQGSDYVTRLSWETPAEIARIDIVALAFGGRLHVRGLALVDHRDGSNVPLVVSTDGRYRQVHSGDVKIYEVLDALPRAYIVHQTRILDDEDAIAAMMDPTFDPAQVAILAGGRALPGALAAGSSAEVTAYAPEQVTVRVTAASPGYLVLSDAWYPGWEATVDGRPAPIERANVHFRAVFLEPGAHTVQFVYRPASYRLGLAISAVTLLALAVCAVVHITRRPRIADV